MFALFLIISILKPINVYLIIQHMLLVILAVDLNRFLFAAEFIFFNLPLFGPRRM
jgi:hypothetical protein